MYTVDKIFTICTCLSGFCLFVGCFYSQSPSALHILMMNGKHNYNVPISMWALHYFSDNILEYNDISKTCIFSALIMYSSLIYIVNKLGLPIRLPCCYSFSTHIDRTWIVIFNCYTRYVTINNVLLRSKYFTNNLVFFVHVTPKYYWKEYWSTISSCKNGQISIQKLFRKKHQFYKTYKNAR